MGLFTVALLCDFLYAWKKRSSFLTAGHWFIIAGLLMSMPTILTGLEAAKMHDPADLKLAKHTLLGYATGIFGSFYAGLRIAVMCWKIKMPALVYVILSLLMVSIVYWTSQSGILLRP